MTTAKCTPQPVPNAGTGLFATGDLDTGTTVLHLAKPFVSVLDTPRLDDTCSNCFGARALPDGGSLSRCTGCRVVKYCDRTCQSKNWSAGHKHECKTFRDLHPRILPNNARAVLRILLLHENKKISEEEFEQFLRLESHTRDLQKKDRERYEKMVLSGKAAKHYSGTKLEEAICADMFGKLDINCINLTTATYDRIGLYLHPYASLFNHSCEHNAVVGFDGGELFVKALRPIRKGEQVCISYIDVTNPYEQRQRELSERYYFRCECPKCQLGTAAREDRFLPPNPASTRASQNDAGPWAAGKKAAEYMATASATEDPSHSAAQLRSALHVLHETGAWPTTRQPYAAARDELIVVLLTAQRFQPAFVHACIRYLRIDPVLFPQPQHPIRQMHAYGLAKLAIFISQGVDVSGASEDRAELDVRKYEINYGLLVLALLDGLARQTDACTVPRFQRMLHAKLEEVAGEFTRNGLDPRALTKEAGVEWAKVENLVNDALLLE